MLCIVILKALQSVGERSAIPVFDDLLGTFSASLCCRADRAVVDEELCGGDVVVVGGGDFEVVDGDGPAGGGDGGDGSGGVVALGEVVAGVELSGEDPAFAVDVEGVFFGDDDGGAVGDGDGHEGGGLFVEQAGDVVEFVGVGVEVAGPDFVAFVDVFDGDGSVVGVDEGAGDEAVAGGVSRCRGWLGIRGWQRCRRGLVWLCR